MRYYLIALYLCLCLALLLAGCTGSATLRTNSTTPVCDALIGPIQYNTANPKSRRHAGPDLAPDLKARNQVGTDLRCPTYR